MKECLGQGIEKADGELKRKTLFEGSLSSIKYELKHSIKKSESSGVTQLIDRVETLSDLFQEMENTLQDIEKERIGSAVTRQIQKNSSNYLELTLQQLNNIKKQSFVDSVGLNLVGLLDTSLMVSNNKKADVDGQKEKNQ